MESKIVYSDGSHILYADETPLLRVEACEGAQDSFEMIADGIYAWKRVTDAPTDRMNMSFTVLQKVNYTQIAALNYNGNGWGKGVEYSGYECEGKPWIYSYSRTSIPACSYSECDKYTAALMADRGFDTAMSFSQYPTEEGMRHSLIWPEEESPYALCKQRMKEAHYFTMEPRTEFFAVIFTAPVTKPRHSWHALYDFAWEYYAHPIPSLFDSKKLWKLGITYAKTLYTEEPDGFCGFSIGLEWKAQETQYVKRWFATKYELGWCGQNISLANALLKYHLETGDRDAKSKALKVIDSWLGHCRLDNGLMYVRTNTMPDPAQKVNDELDACNLGTGALHFFETYELLSKCGIDRPDCIDAAMGICDFALSHQDADGCFAKSWKPDGSLLTKAGSVGCFLVPPLLKAYERTGEAKYLESAERAMGFYYGDFDRDGYTTAGALDTYSIDKESASPMLGACMALYEVTGKREYVDMARNLAYYISSWQWHYSCIYDDTCTLGKIGFDTFGSTGVSTMHNGLDHYALHDVVSFVKLSEATGEKIWFDRACAFWANATQLISDGTLVINGRTRVAGSQDEAICHCRWERMRAGGDFFTPTQWLVAWPCAFRMEIMRNMDTACFDAGYTGK